MRERAAFAALSCGTALLSACAVQAPPHIAESTGNHVKLSSVELVEHAEEGKERAQLAEKLAVALRARGIEVSSGAPFIGDYAIGARLAKSTIVSIGIEQEHSGTMEVESSSRSAKLLDNCKANRVRATFALFERSTGELIYRGAAEADMCESEPIAINALANALASDLVGSSVTAK